MLPIFWSYARPHRARFALGLVLLLLTNALALGIPWLLRGAIAAMERGDGARVVASFAAGIVGLAALQAVVRTASRLAILGASRRIVYAIRSRFFAQLLRLSASTYDRVRTGDIMSRGVNDMQLLRSFYGPGALNVMNTTIVYAGVLVLLLSIDVPLTAISLLLFPLMFLGVNRLSRRVYARSREVQEQLAVISNRAQENFSGIQQIKTYAQEEREIEAFADACAEFRRRNLAMATMRGAMLALIGIVSGAGTLLVLYVGGRHVVEGRITFADFVAFNAYLGLLAWPTIALGWIVNVFQRGVGAMERVQEVLDIEPDVPSPLDAGGAAGAREPASPGGPEIELRDLTFTYPGAARPALSGVTLRVPAGSSLGIVGPVGSGKSTLVDLLARVYPAPPGTIFVDGADVAELPTEALRRSIGYAPQEPFLFSAPLRENLRFGRPEASEEEIEEAVATASLDRDLAEFPAGLDTRVGERGVTLSGGQRQRAALARALVVSPRILILDDSLSAVDADTERRILERLSHALAGRTSLVVSHRPTTLAGLDGIVVLEGGRVVEQGPHDELVRLGGSYARLVERSRLEGRLEEAP